MKGIDLPKGFDKFLLALGTILASLFMSAFFIKPKINQYFETRGVVDKQKAEIGKLSEKVNDLRALSEADLASSYGLLLRALPEAKNFYAVVSSIKKIFQDEGGEIDSYSFNPGTVSTDSARVKDNEDLSGLMTVRINFLADFDKLAKIIERIGNNLPILSISSFSLDSGQETSVPDLGIYSGGIDLTAYNSPLPAAQVSLDKELPKMTSPKMSLIEKLRQHGRVLAEEPIVPEDIVIVGKENPFP